MALLTASEYPFTVSVINVCVQRVSLVNGIKHAHSLRLRNYIASYHFEDFLQTCSFKEPHQ